MKEIRRAAPSMRKVTVDIEGATWHSFKSEIMWCDDVCDNLYQLENTPFYANELAFGDVVEAEADVNGVLRFVRTHSRRGHSTYRIRQLEGVGEARFRMFWKSLEVLGCTYESGLEGRLLAVDVPPSSDIHKVYAVLELGLERDVWDFQEGHCAHVQSKNAR